MGPEQKVVVITGAGRGIGKALAVAFSERRAKLVLCGRDLEALRNVSNIVRQKADDVMVSAVDVGDWNQVSALPDKVLNQFGAIDILVNNAGIAIYKSFLDTSNQDWERVIDTNLMGVLRCCKAVLPAMLQAREGVIVNVASTAGLHGVPNLSIYSASKFAIVGFTQSLAAEVRDRGIKVYAVCPGPTYTDLHRSIVGDEAALSAQPPEKVAEKTVSVVSGETRLAPGGAIVVDGLDRNSAPISSRNAWINPVRRVLKALCLPGRR